MLYLRHCLNSETKYSWKARLIFLFIACVFIGLYGCTGSIPKHSVLNSDRANSYLLSYESGEVLDGEGNLVFKFPGGYPLLLPNGDFFTNRDDLLTRFNSEGEIQFQFQDNFTHDWDYDEKGNLYYFSRIFVPEGRMKLRTSELRIVNGEGKFIDRFHFYKNRKKLEEALGIQLSPIFFSFNYINRKFGLPLSCNCWEFEHFNYVHILKEPLKLKEGSSLPKGTLITSLPFHQRLLAFNPNDFKLIWNFSLPGIHFFHTPIFTEQNSVMIFANNFRHEDQVIEQSGIVEFDLSTGKEIFRFLLPNDLYSPINGSIHQIHSSSFLISVMTGETFYLDRKEGIRPYLDLSGNYLNRGIDFYRAIPLDKKVFPKTGGFSF